MTNQKNKIEDALRDVYSLVQRWCIADKEYHYQESTVRYARPGIERFQDVINELKEVNNNHFFDDVPSNIDQAKSYLIIIENACQEVARMQDVINSKIGSQAIQHHIWLDLYAELLTLQTHLESEIKDLQAIINIQATTQFENLAFEEFSQFFIDAKGKIDISKAEQCRRELKNAVRVGDGKFRGFGPLVTAKSCPPFWRIRLTLLLSYKNDPHRSIDLWGLFCTFAKRLGRAQIMAKV